MAATTSPASSDMSVCSPRGVQACSPSRSWFSNCSISSVMRVTERWIRASRLSTASPLPDRIMSRDCAAALMVASGARSSWEIRAFICRWASSAPVISTSRNSPWTNCWASSVCWRAGSACVRRSSPASSKAASARSSRASGITGPPSVDPDQASWARIQADDRCTAPSASVAARRGQGRVATARNQAASTTLAADPAPAIRVGIMPSSES